MSLTPPAAAAVILPDEHDEILRETVGHFHRLHDAEEPDINYPDTDPERWKRLIRRAEALYALIACRAGGKNGVAGSRWAQ